MPNIQRAQPSERLLARIHECVTGFKKLQDAVNDALEQGHREGYSDKETGDMIRKEMIAAGLHRSTVTRYLPESAKAKPRGWQTSEAQTAIQFSSKMRQNQNQNLTEQLATDSTSKVITVEKPVANVNVETEPEPELEPKPEGEPKPESEPEPVDDSVIRPIPEEYKIELLDQYEKPYLVKIVKYQHDQIKSLHDKLETRKAIANNDQDQITRLKIQLRKAGIKPEGWQTTAAA